MFPFIVAALIQSPSLPDIEFMDSRDDSRITYVIVNKTCKVKINKAELRDYDGIIERVLKKCGL